MSKVYKVEFESRSTDSRAHVGLGSDEAQDLRAAWLTSWLILKVHWDGRRVSYQVWSVSAWEPHRPQPTWGLPGPLPPTQPWHNYCGAMDWSGAFPSSSAKSPLLPQRETEWGRGALADRVCAFYNIVGGSPWS